MADWEDRAGRRPKMQNVGPADNFGWLNTDDAHDHDDCSPKETDSCSTQLRNSLSFGSGATHKKYSSESSADVWNAEEDEREEDEVGVVLPVSPTSHDTGARNFESIKETKAGSVIGHW